MNLLYSSRTPKPEFEALYHIKKVSLETILKESDFICVHAALTPETHHLLNRETLKWVKPSAFIINAARGPLIDESALLDLIESRQIAGAAFDVYEQEPHVPKRLRESPYVLLAPHLGSATYETRLEMCYMAIESSKSVLLGIEGRGVFCC